jgi:hypothetical protein
MSGLPVPIATEQLTSQVNKYTNRKFCPDIQEDDKDRPADEKSVLARQLPRYKYE